MNIDINKIQKTDKSQLQFLDLLKNFILQKGELKKRNLIESPFTMIHPEGIGGFLTHRRLTEF